MSKPLHFVIALAAALVLAGCPFFTAEESSASGGRRPAAATVRVEAPPAPAPTPAPAPRPAAAPTPAPNPAAGETVSARHILIQYQGSTRAAPSIERSKEEALERAQEVLGKARGGEDFAALAGEYSDGPTRTRGGDLGNFGRQRMHPAFEQAAFALDVGGISDVVETPFGYHVIQRYQ
jgi:parvulin-like peptidyl-prolyl isomerase